MLGLALAWLAFAVSPGVEAASLYSASVPVANRSAAERARALPLALQQVLVKVSGDARLADRRDVRELEGRASEILVQSDFREEVSITGNAGGSTLTMVAEFDPASVDTLLRQLGRPVWKAERPRLLVWLVIESGSARQVASANQSAALGALLRQAEQRGFEVLLPTWDYTDQGRAPIESLWLGDLSSVRAASARYGTEAAVLARIRRTADGWNSRYTLIDLRRPQGKGDEWLAIHANASAALADAVDGSANRLAGRYAISPEERLDASYAVQVSSVRSGSDYGRVLSYLEELHIVRAVEPTGADGDRLLLRLDLSVTPSKFAALLEEDGVLAAGRLPSPSGAFDRTGSNADFTGDSVVGNVDGAASADVDAIPLIAETLPVMELDLRQ